MGLFSKKEKMPCPLCGGEVKGLFKTKIGNKVEICKECAAKISMCDEQMETATPEYAGENIAYMTANAQKYADMNRDHEFDFMDEFTVTADEENRLVAIGAKKMNNMKNPLVFSYDDITSYELYRFKKMVDSDKEPGDTATESGLTVLASLSSESTNSTIRIKLTTTNLYWPCIDLKFTFSDSSLAYEGYRNNMRGIGYLFKCIVNKKPYVLPTGALGSNV